MYYYYYIIITVYMYIDPSTVPAVFSFHPVTEPAVGEEGEELLVQFLVHLRVGRLVVPLSIQ